MTFPPACPATLRRIAIAGGSTGGHAILAIGRELRDHHQADRSEL